MTLVVVLVEEPSIALLLRDHILPGILGDRPFRVIPHQGKSDLEKSIPRKLKAAWPPGTRFMILRDNDGGDCLALKERLTKLCPESKRSHTVVRIVCQELESWYLGDLLTIDRSGLVPGSRFERDQRKAKYRDPDRLANAKQEMKTLVKVYKPLSGAGAIGPHLDVGRNQSRSFQVFVDGIRRLANERG
ncbi:DUF4276 family protein [Rhodospirillum sp. A1_3_36]|uniref:DUF4276 family protein n=1 Tax=Rhodospirillum sp. A1_3_36 TaxID=3391666 RepID=UPI0039A69392